MKKICEIIVGNKLFEQFILLVILINCGLIGVETYFTTPFISFIQLSALIIFTIEVVIRFTASDTAKDYFKNGWNVFDLVIVIFCLIPESLFENTDQITTLRVLRVFRVLRLLKTNDEIRLIVSVLAKSINSLFYNFMFFIIFMYLFAIVGVTVFKLPTTLNNTPETKLALVEYANNAPHAPIISTDPYGTLGETMFTLFRVLTGEDWTDLRYNLHEAKSLGLISCSTTFITLYHVSWYVLSVFLLLNLLVGAILTNYQIIMNDVYNNKKGSS